MFFKQSRSYILERYFTPLDNFLAMLHRQYIGRNKFLSICLSMAIYISILLIWGNSLKISCNYFILLPIISVTICYGLAGGFIAGSLGLPINLLAFYIMGHPEYAPASLVVAEVSGILVGLVMGYLSDYFDKLNREIHKRRITEEHLRRTLADKEILLQEVNHRVRNNLNIIKSLIQLHKNRVDDPLFLEECEKLSQRIFSISLVHEQLYREGNSVSLDLKDYLSVLLENLVSGSGRGSIDLKTCWPEGDHPLISDRVISLGLIVHEVIINSMKYAFKGVDFPQITFDLALNNDLYQIIIRDNGTGVEEGGGMESSKGNGLGMKLISSLTAQIGGTAQFRSDKGMVFHLTFPSK